MKYDVTFYTKEQLDYYVESLCEKLGDDNKIILRDIANQLEYALMLLKQIE